MKLVSVIVPIYDVEKCLSRCIDSIINQTYSNIEIILVNDGSPDNCKNICEEYAQKDTRIKFFDNENHGCSFSRNFGLSKSTGEYILFVDSDDYIDDKLIEISLNELEKHDADMVIFDILSIDEINNRKTVLLSNIPVEKDISIANYPNILNAVPAVYNKLMKRSLWIDNGIEFPLDRRYEDLDAIPKILGVSKKIRYYNKPLYFYAFRQGSFIKSAFTQKKYDDIIAAVESVEKFYKQQGIYDSMTDEFEYFNVVHTFFYPSKELIQQKNTNELLNIMRDNIDKKYPNFSKNKYLELLPRNDKILFSLLLKRKYGFMNLMSLCRNIIAKLIKR